MRLLLMILWLLHAPQHLSAQLISIEALPDFDSALVKQINHERIFCSAETLKRNTDLDSAARYHAIYLIRYFLIHGKFGNHKEEYDICDFDEIINSWDRHSNPSAEIIDNEAFGLIYKGQSREEVLKFPTAGLLFDDPYKAFFNSYISSPSHGQIVQMKHLKNQIGTASYMMLWVPPNVKYKDEAQCYLVNVTTFK